VKGNVYMYDLYDSIQVSKRASFRTTSQVTRPNDNKAAGNCIHVLIAGLRPASLILARRIAFPLVLLGAGLVLIQPCAGQSGTWTPTGSLVTARSGHTATLLPNGKVLVAGGSAGLFAATPGAELYDPASGTWTATGSLNTGVYIGTATLLPNGMVLVTGSVGSVFHPPLVALAELYDPASGTWAATGVPVTATRFHTATLLAGGRVLAVAGASAERYDPTSGTWTATGSLATSRDFYTATLLLNGKVLVVGGYGTSGPLASAELYDPASGTWSATGSLVTARDSHTATLLSNGKVLVAGGYGTSSPLASAELYDPASGTWSATGSLDTARFLHTATCWWRGD
jgi:Galactose oxidase, central domain/Kelch motif